MSAKTPPPARPEPFNVKSATFDQLKDHFDKTGCDSDAYAVATWMYARFPEESKKLLPLLKESDVNYKGPAMSRIPEKPLFSPAEPASGPGEGTAPPATGASGTAPAAPPVPVAPITATTDEWASALTAAKKIKDATKGITLEGITDDQVHDKAQKIYKDTRVPDNSCRRL